MPISRGVLPNDFEAALERVRFHLEREFFSRDLPEGSKLPPVRAVARELGVSNGAVYAVYRELQNTGMVFSVVGRGTFIASGCVPSQKLHIAISLAISNRIADQWRNALITGILEAAAEYPEVTVRPFSAASFQGKELPPISEEIRKTDGIILLPMGASDMALLQAECREQGKPAICINPSSPLQTGDFVSADYYRFGLEMGTVWLESGRRNILLLGAVHDAPSWVQRLAGFHTAAGKQQDRLRVHYAEKLYEEDGYRAINALLATGYRPDAVFAFGDLLAVGVRQALLEAGFSIPGEVSIVGGTGMPDTHRLGITTHDNDYIGIGRAALKMMIARNREGCPSVPGVYVPIGLTPRATTRPLEHTIWKQRHKP